MGEELSLRHVGSTRAATSMPNQHNRRLSDRSSMTSEWSFLIPFHPFVQGAYAVTMTVNNRKYKWSFSVGQQPSLGEGEKGEVSAHGFSARRLHDDTDSMGSSSRSKGAIYAGIAGIVGPTLCWYPASGLKGSLMVGDLSQKFGGLAMAILFVAVSLGIVYHSGYRIGLWGHPFSGVTWSVVGFIVGWLAATSRRHAPAL
jgi:hypothetical protein